MSESEEYRLAKSLVWSTREFSLEKFVEKYELPQVVLVESGYCGDNERTTFSKNEILTLHTVQNTSKILCNVPNSNAILVPTSCELKAEILPMDCNNSTLTAHELSTANKKIKYIRVKQTSLESTSRYIDDMLQIKKIDHDSSTIRCRSVKSGENVLISFDSTEIFVPLIDSTTHTIAEIKKKFGLPAKVRFLDKEAELKMRSASGRRQPTTYLTDLDHITAIEEIQDSHVIATMVCCNLAQKVICKDSVRIISY